MRFIKDKELYFIKHSVYNYCYAHMDINYSGIMVDVLREGFNTILFMFTLPHFNPGLYLEIRVPLNIVDINSMEVFCEAIHELIQEKIQEALDEDK